MTDTEQSAETPWERTLAALHDREEELTAAGYQTAAVPAGHLTAEPPDAGESDRFGFVFVAPGDAAPAFTEAYETGEFTDFRVFRRVEGTDLFLLIELRDDDGGVAVLLAGAVAVADLENIREPTREAGIVYSHVQLLDYTHLGSFRHDDPDPFFPEDAV